MSNFDKELEKFSDMLFENEVIKDYFHLKEVIANNEELKLLQNQITHNAQQMTLNINNDEVYLKSKVAYEEALAKYNAHPLINNLNVVAKDVEMILLEIKKIIE